MRILFTFFYLIASAYCLGQDLYVKSYSLPSGQVENIQVESLKNGNYVVAGHSNTTLDSSKLFVRKFNSCGDELWAKEISDNANPLKLVELNVDSAQNIILTGRKGKYNQNPLPFIIKLDPNGSLLYSKLLNSTLGYYSLIYSSSIAPNGDIYLFGIHRYTTSPPNNHKYYVARLTSNGNLKWAKNLSPFAYTWGRMLATKDGGVLGKMANTIFKLDSLGNKEWAKDYTYPGDLITAIETDSGYVFARYYIGAIDRGSVFSIRHDGSILWATPSYFNFFPFRGITRKNGNVLFPGNNHFNQNAAVFLELDFKDGSELNFVEMNNSQELYATDLSENLNGNIVIAGPDNRGTVPQLMVGKLNDTLSTLSCNNTRLPPPGDPYSVSFLNDNPLTSFNNTDLITTNVSFVSSPILGSSYTPKCTYTKPRGSYMLGADTSLCFGQSIILGSQDSTYDAYLWSTGSTNKNIVVNQSGSYWRQVVSACDTLRDTIKVSYLPGILFSLGSDTLVCSNSVVLGSPLDTSLNYIWSTGEATRTITVNTAGYYWVEYKDHCNTTRDSIFVDFYSPLSKIFLGNDTILCQKQKIVLGDSASLFTNFLWSNGSTDKRLTVNKAGVYWLEASNSCQSSSDTIRVNYYPAVGISLGNDTTLCPGNSIILKPAEILTNYLWSTGSINSTISVNQTGTYWLETQTNCGTVRDSINVSEETSLTSLNLGNDTTLCFGETLELEAVNGVNYSWSTQQNTQTIVAGKGIYWLEYFNKCDTIRDSIKISYYPLTKASIEVNKEIAFTFDTLVFINKTAPSLQTIWNFGNGVVQIGDTVKQTFELAGNYQVILSILDTNNCLISAHKSIAIKVNEYFAPNVFTPNNDNINDEFLPIGNDIKTFSIKVFNRWGKLIFEGNDVAWRGKSSSGYTLNEGIYHYILNIELFDGKKDILKGDVTLVR